MAFGGANAQKNVNPDPAPAQDITANSAKLQLVSHRLCNETILMVRQQIWDTLVIQGSGKVIIPLLQALILTCTLEGSFAASSGPSRSEGEGEQEPRKVNFIHTFWLQPLLFYLMWAPEQRSHSHPSSNHQSKRELSLVNRSSSLHFVLLTPDLCRAQQKTHTVQLFQRAESLHQTSKIWTLSGAKS